MKISVIDNKYMITFVCNHGYNNDYITFKNIIDVIALMLLSPMLFKTKSNTILKYSHCTYIGYKMKRKVCLHCLGNRNIHKKIVILFMITITLAM